MTAISCGKNPVIVGPRVSIVIPAYNAGSLIVEALESVFEQTYQDFEIIIVDDASTDDSYELLGPYLSRIRFVRQEHAGSAVARNRGVLSSTGELIAFLDADDLWLPTKLQKQIEYLGNNPDCILVYADFTKSDTGGDGPLSALMSREHWQVGAEFESLLRQNFVHTSSVIVRKDALSESGLFDPVLTNAQDWDLWIRLASVGKFGFIDEVLSHYRMHGNQSVNTLRFARNVVYSDHVMLARWRNDPDALSSIRSKTGRDYFKLGRKEWRLGNRKEARRAFWQSAKFKQKRLKSLGWALLSVLPPLMLRMLYRKAEERRD
jgi:glycosyltransferase involved in cell wall biosynthesis